MNCEAIILIFLSSYSPADCFAMEFHAESADNYQRRQRRYQPKEYLKSKFRTKHSPPRVRACSAEEWGGVGGGAIFQLLIVLFYFSLKILRIIHY
jgi:hypothetical protein